MALQRPSGRNVRVSPAQQMAALQISQALPSAGGTPPVSPIAPTPPKPEIDERQQEQELNTQRSSIPQPAAGNLDRGAPGVTPPVDERQLEQELNTGTYTPPGRSADSTPRGGSALSTGRDPTEQPGQPGDVAPEAASSAAARDQIQRETRGNIAQARVPLENKLAAGSGSGAGNNTRNDGGSSSSSSSPWEEKMQGILDQHAESWGGIEKGLQAGQSSMARRASEQAAMMGGNLGGAFAGAQQQGVLGGQQMALNAKNQHQQQGLQLQLDQVNKMLQSEEAAMDRDLQRELQDMKYNLGLDISRLDYAGVTGDASILGDMSGDNPIFDEKAEAATEDSARMQAEVDRFESEIAEVEARIQEFRNKAARAKSTNESAGYDTEANNWEKQLTQLRAQLDAAKAKLRIAGTGNL